MASWEGRVANFTAIIFGGQKQLENKNKNKTGRQRVRGKQEVVFQATLKLNPHLAIRAFPGLPQSPPKLSLRKPKPTYELLQISDSYANALMKPGIMYSEQTPI